MLQSEILKLPGLSLSRETVLGDYRIACQSRHMSLIGRREVMSGRAKFGIFGDGKEVVQVAMAHAFEAGDFRSGYYRDQTLILALQGPELVAEYFHQLYAHTDIRREPATGGRAMNAHFASRSLDPDGTWRDLTQCFNSSADVSPTASQMPRLVGLGYASVLYRQLVELKSWTQFSHNGDEIAWGTIGNASTAEGLFWEALNAIGVLQAPVVLAIYDDGYGISVPNEFQLTKGDLSQLLAGFRREPQKHNGFNLQTVRGWDYPALVETFRQVSQAARQEHIPAIVHVTELTQPQGHSTSGSHERYKPPERLEWEREFDALKKFRAWITAQGLAKEEELEAINLEARQFVEDARTQAWQAYSDPIQAERETLSALIEQASQQIAEPNPLEAIRQRLLSLPSPLRRDLASAAHEALVALRHEPANAHLDLAAWRQKLEADQLERFSSHLYSQSTQSALKIAAVKPVYAAHAPEIYGFEILNACFDAMFQREPRLVAFGEDIGKLGDVNQGMRGLQEKYGPLRISDTGIREATILGQAIGLAMRGLRPIAEIQYLDYLLYSLQIMSDDLATLHWRTAGGQKAPVIVRTRGHRLEGVWHSGSPMAAIIHLLRGMVVFVPRNMTQAAAFYNTLLLSDEPGLVVETLNGYRLREPMPENLDQITLPPGLPEVLRTGTDLTLVTYGACCRIVGEAARLLAQTGIEAEVIDVQSLLPFDRPGMIGDSIRKTSRVIFIDEDVPGGTTAYMLQEVLEKQGGYAWLDSAPRTLSAQPHRPAYGSDGDYWSKPNREQVFDAAYQLMHEVNPQKFPLFSQESA
jgi:pyruvate/2-oxoglutarate/acetoin dehydrogenase E1 component/TPP-dependent pyruvate/acetoin dehydrogenase alpha subunit